MLLCVLPDCPETPDRYIINKSIQTGIVPDSMKIDSQNNTNLQSKGKR